MASTFLLSSLPHKSNKSKYYEKPSGVQHTLDLRTFAHVFPFLILFFVPSCPADRKRYCYTLYLSCNLVTSSLWGRLSRGRLGRAGARSRPLPILCLVVLATALEEKNKTSRMLTDATTKNVHMKRKRQENKVPTVLINTLLLRCNVQHCEQTELGYL